MRTLATDVCPEYGPHDIDQHADGLLATIADMPAGWHAFIEFDPDAEMLEAGCNLTAWRRYISALARNLADRGAGRNAAGSARDATTVDAGGTRPGRPAKAGNG